MSAKFLGKKFPGAFVIGALALAAGVLFAMPCRTAHADVFSPGFVKEMINSGEIDLEDDIAQTFLNESAMSTVDVEAEYKATYNGTKWNDSYTKADLKYLSCIIYCEANSMSNAAKVAVGNVVLNRVRNTGDWAHVTTIKEVIYDRKWAVQFSPTVNGSLDKALKLYKSMDPEEFREWEIEYMNNCIEAAKQVLRGKKTIPDNFYYFNGYVTSSKKKCEDSGKTYRIMGAHIYF
ncbi:MAG: cell wall hydrolase [Lachnospiraceae bacterium]|nr:cell wall hydrolase [Lachnospiraceae bacterium]